MREAAGMESHRTHTSPQGADRPERAGCEPARRARTGGARRLRTSPQDADRRSAQDARGMRKPAGRGQAERAGRTQGASLLWTGVGCVGTSSAYPDVGVASPAPTN